MKRKHIRIIPPLSLIWLLATCAPDQTAPATGGSAILRDYACKACRVVVDSVAYLGHPGDTVAFREDVLPARDSRGRFYVADRSGGAVHVFGTNGRLMMTFGKLGRGPGELTGIRAIYVSANDTLLVIGG